MDTKTDTNMISIPHTDVTTTTVPGDSSDLATTTGASIAGIVVFIFVIIVVIVVKRRFKKEKDEEEEGESESESDSEAAAEAVQMRLLRHQATDSDIRKVVSDNALLGVVTSVLVDVRRITLSRQLGKGQFGAVYEAKLARDKRSSNDYGSMTHEKVAVKTLKGGGMDVDEVEGFLREGLIMKDFHHPHVLGLVGVAFGDHSIPMIILPYMENGSLRSYITDPDRGLTIRHLLTFAHQVALGMDYLAKQKFVHRDLATRNCMLDDQVHVKVADFGLSRDIYTKEYYASSDHHARLPVKWMSPESLTKALYTTKSDVWSYGILMWELMTRGVTPYPDVANWDIRAYVCAGRRMPKPQMCPDDIYDIMLRCWRDDPHERPWFADLALDLEEILSDREEERTSGQFYTNVEPMTP